MECLYKYMIISGVRGDIIDYTNDNSEYPSLWELPAGSTADYWVYVKLPEDRQEVIK